jgi:MaoC like domain
MNTRLARYSRVCGFPLRDELPPTYPHVLAFPQAVRAMLRARVRVLGLVHVANRIEVLRPIPVGEPLALHVRVADLSVTTEASVAGEVVWRELSTYVHAGKGGGRARRPSEPPPAPSAIWTVPGDIGRRYARVSGDWNPIHLHPLTARLFGMPGPIAHGMWTLARCLAALELPASYVVEARFKRPLRIPGRVGFSHGDGAFGVHSIASGEPHLSGTFGTETAHLGTER